MKNWSKLLLLGAATLIMSCGDKKEEKEEIKLGDYENTSTTETTTSTSAVENAADNSVVELKLTANDQMQFNKNELRAKAGQTVKLTLKHIGEMPKNAMGHNFVLLKEGTDVAEFGNAAATAEANGYIPEGTDKVIAHTEMIGGGEQATVEFEAPAPGTYTFICSFPGHYAIMKGQFIVE